MSRTFRPLTVAVLTAATAGIGLIEAAASSASSPTVAVSCSSHSFPLARGGSVSDYTVDCSATDSTSIDSYALVGSPAHAASYSLDPATGAVHYTAAAGYVGVDTLRFTATSGTATSAVAVLTFQIDNTAPTCTSIAPRSIGHDRTLAVHPVCTDAEHDHLTLVAGTVAPAHGKVTISGGAVRYTPKAGFVGADHFSFRATDGALASAQQTVRVAVTDAKPICTAASLKAAHDRVRTIHTQCTDANHDHLVPTVVARAQHGTVSVRRDGTLAYRPAKHFVGRDTFTYTVSDGVAKSATTRVRVEVGNRGPRLLHVPARLTLRRAATFTVKTVDANGDKVALHVARAPKHGTVAIHGRHVTYRRDAGFHGADSFSLKASDGVTSVTKTVHVTVR